MSLISISSGARSVKGGHRRFPLHFLLSSALLLALEIILRISAETGPFFNGFSGLVFTALSVGCLISLLAAIPRSPNAGRAILIVLCELFTIWFLIAYFTDDAYGVFMPPAMIVSEAGNVVGGFSSTLLSVVTKGFPIILLYHVPVILLLFLRKKLVRESRGTAFQLALLLAGVLLFGLLASLCDKAGERSKAKYTYAYSYDSCVRYFGVVTGLELELRNGIFGVPESNIVFDLPEKAAAKETPAAKAEEAVKEVPSAKAVKVPEEAFDGKDAPVGESPEDTALEVPEEAVEYGENAIDVDFEAMEGKVSSIVARLNEYIESVEPTKKNKYTGLFEGKNLILISAESFSRECIDENITPMLYRMANRGIVFEEFYQPSWGGSTSTGEYSWIMGLKPSCPDAMFHIYGKYMPFTMGNQLKKLGYSSHAYHDGTVDYYSRNTTHTLFGYDEYIAIGNGMEEGIDITLWPESDREMMEFTLPKYIGEEHFSVYYMSVSGHFSYYREYNSMADKNYDVYADMDVGEPVKCYLAANYELELAMEYLVEELEKAGKADDTVIAICPDHYPYGLEDSVAWDTGRNYLYELYGVDEMNNQTREHSIAIIWSGCLEDLDEPIRVTGPSYSLDLLPTLSNLFGLEYDSRMLTGRDVLSDAEPLVIWLDGSWKTDVGYFDSIRQTFTPNEAGVEVDQEYIDLHEQIVRNKVLFANNAIECDYYRMVLGGGT